MIGTAAAAAAAGGDDDGDVNGDGADVMAAISNTGGMQSIIGQQHKLAGVCSAGLLNSLLAAWQGKFNVCVVMHMARADAATWSMLRTALTPSPRQQ